MVIKNKAKYNLPFKSSKALSIGVELELQVLDKGNLLLTPRAAALIERSGSAEFKHEFFQSTLEIITGICKNVQEVEQHFLTSLQLARTSAEQLGLALASTGTHPLADYRERLITESPRYNELIDRNQWLIRRMAVYGMHIHLGMASGDSCVRFNYFFMNVLPHILALSGSSPFWQGMYTGLSSCRPTTYEALPTAGMPYTVKDWTQFQNLYTFLIRSKAIRSMKDLWWDLRPSPENGTLELRFCDEPATLYEAMGIVAFVHALGYWFQDHEHEWSQTGTPLKKWIFRENKWRAIRYGLDAEIVVKGNGVTLPLRDDIEHWLEKVEPYIKRLRYEKYIQAVREILKHGNSSQRQHTIYETTGNLMEVVKNNVAEFNNGKPAWSRQTVE
jgi:glutamate---cysteine ligase / carboxylate-amine ligase